MERLVQTEVLRHSHPRKRGLVWRMSVGGWIATDALIAIASMYGAYLFSPYSRSLIDGSALPHLSRFYATVLFLLLLPTTNHIFGLHNSFQPRQFWLLAVRCLGSVCSAFGVLSVLVFAVFYHQIGRYILVQSAVYSIALVILARLIAWREAGHGLHP